MKKLNLSMKNDLEIKDDDEEISERITKKIEAF